MEMEYSIGQGVEMGFEIGGCKSGGGASGKSFAYGIITAVQGTFGKFYALKSMPYGIATETEVE